MHILHVSHSVAIALPSGFFGLGPPITTSRVRCDGSEARLTECIYNVNGFCFPTQVASVLCQCELSCGTIVCVLICIYNSPMFQTWCISLLSPPPLAHPPPSPPSLPPSLPPSSLPPSLPSLPPANNVSCANGEFRLADSSDPHQGRLEVCFNGHWGSVCQVGWTNIDALTVCSILGYTDSPRKHTLSVV